MLNFKNPQPSAVTSNMYGIPVGTDKLVEYKNFKLGDEYRDLSCTKCKNGLRSMLRKEVGGKWFNVPLVCSCVPYIAHTDEEGTEKVIYKGRGELWPKGKRPESYIEEEMIRKQTALEAIKNAQRAQSGDKSLGANQKFELGKMTMQELQAAGLTSAELNELTPKTEDSTKGKPGFVNPNSVPKKVQPASTQGPQYVDDTAGKQGMAVGIGKAAVVPPSPAAKPELPKIVL